MLKKDGYITCSVAQDYLGCIVGVGLTHVQGVLYIIQRYHSNMPLIFLISHAQLISPRSVHITRLISNAVCSATSLTWKRVNS